MKRYISPFLSALLIFSPVYGNAEGEKKIAKSEEKDGDNKEMPKPKNIDKEYGQEGTLNESKSALISVDPLALQNYSQTSNNFDFSTYDKVTLKSVILETLSHSNDLKSANEKVIQTELSYKEAYSGYLPTVDFQYSVKKVHNAETGDDTIDKPTHRDFNEENYKFTLRQSLYTGGATEFKVKSLKSKLEEAKRKYTIVLEEEIQKAIKAYFGVLFNHKSVVVNERNMEKLNKILEITQIKYDSGALSIGDLSAVKANIANASGKLIRVKSDLADAIDFYLYTVGEDFTKTAPYEENFPVKLTTLEALYEDILENNLNLVNYRLNIQSTKDKLLNMKASFKPKVDLELNYKNVLDKEDFTANEETYDAKVTLNYNLYNGGKDTIATMQVFSSLQELNFRYKEEIKKLKWEISKLYNSIKSLEDTLLNTKKEVAASAEMVNSYWEGFQLGEQDLQVLLQGQRQLNGAELDLIKYEQDHLTNVFKLITSKGELSKYFGIDGGHPDFIDFSNTSGVKQAPKIDLTTTDKMKIDSNATVNSIETNATDGNITNDDEITQNRDLNSTIDQYLEVVKEASFDDTINFKDKFLEADDESYTVMISDFTNHYDAYTFAKKNRLLDQAFSYEYLNKKGDFATNNSKTKMIDVKTNIAYGIYPSVEEGQTAINNIFDKGEKVYKIVKIKEIKELYNQYIEGLEAKVDPFVIKPKVIKTFMTNQEFKNRFLSAPASYYSINVVSLSQMEQAQNLIKQENIEKDSFVFRYGRNGMWVKVMFGVFATYEQAMSELSKHPEMIKKYRPVIERIGQKQDLYNTYKEFNPLPQWYLDEQKEKKGAKVTPKSEEKKTNTKNEVVVFPEDIITEEPLPEVTKDDIEPIINEEKTNETLKPLDNNVVSNIEQPKVEEKVEPVVEQLPVATQEEIQPQSETTQVLEKELPKEEVETPQIEEKALQVEETQSDDTKTLALPTPVVVPIIVPVTTPTVSLPTIEKSESVEPASTNVQEEQPKVEEKVEPVVEQLPVATQEEIQPQSETTLALEKELPKEEVETPLVAQEIQPIEIAPAIANETTQTVTQVESLKDTPIFKKEDYSSFKEAFANAPNEYYTIKLGAIPSNQRDAFVKRFILDKNFTEFSTKGKTHIYYGIFENIEKAREQKFNLHPKLIDSVKLYKLDRIGHNRIATVKQQPEKQEMVEVKKDIESSELEKGLQKASIIKLFDNNVVSNIEQPKVEEKVEPVVEQLPVATQEEIQPQSETTQVLEKELPKEEVETPQIEEKALQVEETQSDDTKTLALPTPVVVPIIVPVTTPTVSLPTIEKSESVEPASTNVQEEQPKVEEKVEPVVEQLPVATQEEIQPQSETTPALEKELPKEEIETPLVAQEIQPIEIAPAIANETTQTVTQVESLKDTPIFKKEDYSSFKEAFANAPSEYYTIKLGAIPSNQRDAFVKRFILDKNFTEFSTKGKTHIYYGIFENIEKAREQKFNLHPKLIDSVKLYKVGRITK